MGGGGVGKRESVERRSGIQGHWLFVVLRDTRKFICAHSSAEYRCKIVIELINKLTSPCCMLYRRWFPGIWILYADVSEHSVYLKSRITSPFLAICWTNKSYRHLSVSVNNPWRKCSWAIKCMKGFDLLSVPPFFRLPLLYALSNVSNCAVLYVS